MEVAKITDKWQITIPNEVRQKLKLKSGDKVIIMEENGRFYLENSTLRAFERVAQAFDGAAIESGFSDEQSLQDYMRGIRKEVRGVLTNK